MDENFQFSELTWVTTNGVGKAGEWAKEDKEHIHHIRDLHPELKCWGDLAIGIAFGSYSQDILEVSWADWIQERDLEFLGYIYIVQKSYGFDFRSVMNSELTSYSNTLPWLSNAELPDWAIKRINQKISDQRSMENYKFINDIALMANNLTISDEQHEAINTILNTLPVSADFKEKLNSCLIKNARMYTLSQKSVEALIPLQKTINNALENLKKTSVLNRMS